MANSANAERKRHVQLMSVSLKGTGMLFVFPFFLSVSWNSDTMSDVLAISLGQGVLEKGISMVKPHNGSSLGL